MVLFHVGEKMGMADLEMELLLIETHRLKHLVLELEELQSQSLQEATTLALFLMMDL
jgi:hypothetical protein